MVPIARMGGWMHGRKLEPVTASRGAAAAARAPLPG